MVSRIKKENRIYTISSCVCCVFNWRTRNDNRKKIGNQQNNPDIDNKLLEYDSYNRNPNDLLSYKGRVEILNERFTEYYQKQLTRNATRLNRPQVRNTD